MPDQSPVAALEAIARQVDDKSIAFTEACTIARRDIAPLLDLPLVSEAGDRQLGRAADGDWRGALTFLRLLLDAIEQGEPGGDRDALFRQAVSAYLYVATAACLAIPDGRVFSDARKRAESALRTATEGGPEAGELLHRLGVLHLDPFCTGRRWQDFEATERLWRGRLADAYGQMIASQPEAALPETESALTSAIDYFDRALRCRTGRARGFTLKALCGALMWRGRIMKVEARELIGAYAREAIALMPADYHPELIRFANEFGDGAAGSEGGASEAAGLIEADPALVIAAHGLRRAIDMYQIAIDEAADRDPLVAIETLARLWPHLRGSEQATDRERLAIQLASYCLRSAGQAGCTLQAGEPIEQAYSRARDLAAGEEWDLMKWIAVLAGLGISTQTLDRELEGINCIEEAMRWASELGGLSEALGVSRAVLLKGAGANCFNTEDFEGAAEQYLQAVGAYAELGLHDQALAALDLAQEAGFSDDRAIAPFVLGLGRVGTQLLTDGPARTDERLRAIWEMTVARALWIGLTGRPINIELWWLVMQAAKGANLAVRIARPGDYDWRSDAEAQALLARIGELRARIGYDPHASGIGDNLLLSAFQAVVAEDVPGDRARRQRLEQRFDNLVIRRAAGSADVLESLLLTERTRALLDPETVLLAQYFGRSVHGDPAVIFALLTREDAYAAQGAADLRLGSIEASMEDESAHLSWYAFVAAELRDHVVEEPGPDPVSIEAEEGLAKGHANLLGGGIKEKLDELFAKGKRHLCIHPHDALHFYPQHLIGPPSRPLADEWTVTYVPHVSILRRRERGDGQGDLLPVTAFGLSYQDGEPHGQHPLPGAETEANEVAAAMGGLSIVGKDATEAALRNAFAGSARIHIACHGQLNVAAPAFQCLFLQPGGEDDGVFHAYEVIGVDLGHIELVTLSACETALGRFDALDNLRGFVANLLASGVGTVISCLWPVVDEVSKCFFQTLYQRLAEGDPLLGAFRRAQEATREAHPQYRDWGAFHFAGSW